MQREKRSRGGKMGKPIVVPPQVKAGLLMLVQQEKGEVREVLQIERSRAVTPDELRSGLVAIMVNNKISAEELLTNFFTKGALSAHSGTLGKSTKGTEPTLAARINRAWMALPVYDEPVEAEPVYDAAPAMTMSEELAAAAAKATAVAQEEAAQAAQQEADEAEEEAQEAKRQKVAPVVIVSQRAAAAPEEAAPAPAAAAPEADEAVPNKIIGLYE